MNDAINQLVVGATTEQATLFLVGAIGLSVTLLALSIMHFVSDAAGKQRRRVRQIVELAGSGSNRSGRRVENAIAPVRTFVLPKSIAETTAIRRQLVAAGHHDDSAIAVYYVGKLGLAFVLGFVAWLGTRFAPMLSTTSELALVGGCAFVGMLLPAYILRKQVIKRKRLLINAFPDMLDMLVTCSEAGLGLNAALQRVAREMVQFCPQLAQELNIVHGEIQAGIDRIYALQGMAARTGIPELSGFVVTLSQSLRFGTGISDTLRIYTEEFRDKRTQRAEAAAATVGTKLVFPLILCMFPAFFIVAIGPAAITFIRTISA